MKTRRVARRPRVLYLSFYFPPSRASGVYRGRATANHLASRGWDVTVCAAPFRFLHEVIGSVDEDLAATVDPRIHIERPSMSLFPWEKDLRQYSRFRAAMPIVAQTLYQWGQHSVFPEPYASWGLAAALRAVRLHARGRFDVALATGNPFASFAAAWLFHRLTGVPYVLDYRDSWTLNLFTDAPAFPETHKAWTWERRVLRRASAIVFVNEALRGWHAERYPEVADRMMVVPNGWDRDLMVTSDGLAAADSSGGHGPLSYGYLGTLTNSQPVEELAEAFRRARSHPELADAELNIYGHLGFFKGHQIALARRLGLDSHEDDGSDDPVVLDSGIRYRGPVSKTDVNSVYEDSDVLVFLAGGGRYVTSGKIFEYMASGRPIVSVHAPGIAAAEVLDGYPLWFNANSLDVQDVAESMIAAGKSARDLTDEQRVAAQRHAETYARENLLCLLEDRLTSLIRRPVVIRPEPGRETRESHAHDPEPSTAHELAGEGSSGEVGSDAVRRVVVVHLNYKVSRRVVDYVDHLARSGVDVDVFVADRAGWPELTTAPMPRIHTPRYPEHRHPLLRLERFFVYRVPGGSLARAERLVARSRLTRPLVAPLDTIKRLHRRAADAFHRRLFMRAFNLLRPQFMAWMLRKQLRQVDLGGIDRIVAADVYSIPLGRKLAARLPTALATTSLER